MITKSVSFKERQVLTAGETRTAPRFQGQDQIGVRRVPAGLGDSREHWWIFLARHHKNQFYSEPVLHIGITEKTFIKWYCYISRLLLKIKKKKKIPRYFHCIDSIESYWCKVTKGFRKWPWDKNVNATAKFILVTWFYSNNPLLFGGDVYSITKTCLLP